VHQENKHLSGGTCTTRRLTDADMPQILKSAACAWRALKATDNPDPSGWPAAFRTQENGSFATIMPSYRWSAVCSIPGFRFAYPSNGFARAIASSSKYVPHSSP